jgi:hypothetical protein
VKLNGSHVSSEAMSPRKSAKRRTSAISQLASWASKSTSPAASRTYQWLRSRDLPKSFSSMPTTLPLASSTSWRPRNSKTLLDLIMNSCASASGDRRKRMSSRIFIRFCLTNSSGSPSSVEPSAGTLMRYSLAIGLKTCWTRKRSLVSMALMRPA